MFSFRYWELDWTKITEENNVNTFVQVIGFLCKIERGGGQEDQMINDNFYLENAVRSSFLSTYNFFPFWSHDQKFFVGKSKLFPPSLGFHVALRRASSVSFFLVPVRFACLRTMKRAPVSVVFDIWYWNSKVAKRRKLLAWSKWVAMSPPWQP
jgi:hypothetical protein